MDEPGPAGHRSHCGCLCATHDFHPLYHAALARSGARSLEILLPPLARDDAGTSARTDAGPRPVADPLPAARPSARQIRLFTMAGHGPASTAESGWGRYAGDQ